MQLHIISVLDVVGSLRKSGEIWFMTFFLNGTLGNQPKYFFNYFTPKIEQKY